MNAFAILIIGLALGWIGGFIHRGAMYEEEERRREYEAQRRNRDHLNLGGPH